MGVKRSADSLDYADFKLRSQLGLQADLHVLQPEYLLFLNFNQLIPVPSLTVSSEQDWISCLEGDEHSHFQQEYEQKNKELHLL